MRLQAFRTDGRVELAEVRAEFSADMQFIGQTHLLRIPLPSATPTRAELQDRFEAAYHARFRVTLPTIRANLVNLNCSVIGHRPETDLSRLIDPADRRPSAEPKSRRTVWFGPPHDTPVYWRDHLPLSATIHGPAIIEQMDTTTLIDPGCTVTLVTNVANGVYTFRSTFATTDANFAWAEWAVFNAAAAGRMLNRAVSALGTKTSAQSWQLTVTITIA